jgi:hypothetical protein
MLVRGIARGLADDETVHWDAERNTLRLALGSRTVELHLDPLAYQPPSKKRRVYKGITSHIGLSAVTYGPTSTSVPVDEKDTPEDAARALDAANKAKASATQAKHDADFCFAHPVHLSTDKVRAVFDGLHDPHKMKRLLSCLVDNLMDPGEAETGQEMADSILQVLREKEEWLRDDHDERKKHMVALHKAFVKAINRETA